MAATRVAVGGLVATTDENDALISKIGTATIVANSANITSTTSTSVLTYTASLINGKTYSILFSGRISSSVSGDFVTVRIKTVNAAGTDLNKASLFVGTTNAGGLAVECYAEYTAAATGSVVFVATVERSTGATGTINVKASTTGPAFLTVDYLGI